MKDFDEINSVEKDNVDDKQDINYLLDGLSDDNGFESDIVNLTSLIKKEIKIKNTIKSLNKRCKKLDKKRAFYCDVIKNLASYFETNKLNSDLLLTSAEYKNLSDKVEDNANKALIISQKIRTLNSELNDICNKRREISSKFKGIVDEK